MSETETISAIVPVHNGARFMGEALDSIFAQKPGVDEVIVVDDGSTDDSAEFVRSWAATHPELPVRLISAGGKGPAAARNAGVTAASGRLLTFLDVDDLWPENKLKVHLDHLRNTPELDVIVGLVRFVCIDGSTHSDERMQEQRDGLTHYQIGSGLYRRRVFDVVGGYAEDMRFGEDVDWFLRLREESKLRGARQTEPGLIYRLHGANMSADYAASKAGMFRAIKRSMDRRRKLGLSSVDDFPLLAPLR